MGGRCAAYAVLLLGNSLLECAAAAADGRVANKLTQPMLQPMLQLVVPPLQAILHTGPHLPIPVLLLLGAAAVLYFWTGLLMSIC
jgi:hypothetical protein